MEVAAAEAREEEKAEVAEEVTLIKEMAETSAEAVEERAAGTKTEKIETIMTPSKS